ncbi:MAG: toxin HicA [Actinomycetota bacterium]|nr:toxin HicA [Actinomycetota bacterium]
MAQVDQILSSMRANPVGVRYSDLMKVCANYFGQPRQKGLAPGAQDTVARPPRVNVQTDKGHACQVRQVLRAITKLED